MASRGTRSAPRHRREVRLLWGADVLLVLCTRDFVYDAAGRIVLRCTL